MEANLKWIVIPVEVTVAIAPVVVTPILHEAAAARASRAFALGGPGLWFVPTQRMRLNTHIQGAAAQDAQQHIKVEQECADARKCDDRYAYETLFLSLKTKH